MKESRTERTAIRLTPEDKRRIAAIKKKLGVAKDSEVIRMGLKCLYERECEK